jgi:hypothetical protein
MLIGTSLTKEVVGDLMSSLRLFLMLWAQRRYGMIMESSMGLWCVLQLHARLS